MSKATRKISALDFKYFPLAFHRSADLKDIAQLAVFVHRVMPNFKIIEEFAQIITMKDISIGQDISRAL